MDARLSLLALALFCAQALAFEHTAWDALLKKHVVLLDGGKASQLDYAGMAQERAALRDYLLLLSEVKKSEFGRWSRAEQMARRFLSDRSRNRMRGGRLEVSKIFDWFKEDFEPRARYFARYAALLAQDPEEQNLISQGKARLAFLDYDWTLNDFRSSSPR